MNNTLKRTFILLAAQLLLLPVFSQKVSVKWELSDTKNLSASTITGDTQGLITASYLAGNAIAKIEPMSSGNADTGYEAPIYDPRFSWNEPVAVPEPESTFNTLLGVTPSRLQRAASTSTRYWGYLVSKVVKAREMAGSWLSESINTRV